MNFLQHRRSLYASVAFAPFDEGSEEAAIAALEALDNPTAPESSSNNVTSPAEETTPELEVGLEDGHEEHPEADGDDEGGTEESPEGEGDDPSGGADEPRADPFASVGDDAEVSIGDHKIKFGELKALAGQTMALHEAGQALVKQREEVATLRSQYLDGLKAVHAGAKERWEQVARVDTAQYKANSTPEEWEQFQQYANKTYQDLQTAEAAVKGLQPQVDEAQNAARQERMTACAKALLDPATGIPGYGQEAHEANMKFAKSMGFSDETLNDLTDPAAWKIINLAAKQARSEQVIQTKIKPKQVTKAATPANKGGSGKGTGKGAALARLQKTGSTDDAISAILELDNK